MAEKIKISDATRKAVILVLNQQKGDFAAKHWGTLEHAFGIARLAELCGIGDGTEEEQKLARKEFAKEFLDGWSYASNLAKKLASDDIKLIPAKAATPTGEYE